MRLQSKSIKMRFVEESDAPFILQLRLDPRYNQFLSTVSPDVQAQVEWIKKYKSHESVGSEYYFIIERNDETPCGTVRVYDFKKDSFSWGSWILNENKTRYAAIESAFLIYEFGFQRLGFNKSHFEVMKGNDRVVSFHEKMGAEKVGEDADHFFYEIKKETVNAKKELYLGKLI